MNDSLAPIVLFVYNRLWHTRQTVEALQKNELAKDSILYIFSDGPKANSTKLQINKIDEIRLYIHNISGFKKVIIQESKNNKGLANSVITGVSSVINKHGKIIVLEDDIVTHPFFLRFMNDALEKYKNTRRIFAISGFNNNIKIPWWYNKDIYCVHRTCSWGWATWDDRWHNVDWEAKGWDTIGQNPKKKKQLNRGGDDIYPMLVDQMNGRLDSWAIRWEFRMYQENSVCIRPTKSLVMNIGFDGSGVHCGIMNDDSFVAPFYQDKKYHFHFPSRINCNKVLEIRFKQFQDNAPTLNECIKYSINKRISKIKRVYLKKS